MSKISCREKASSSHRHSLGTYAFIFILGAFSLFISKTLFAADKDSGSSKKKTIQQVGGLYFDVDEGVKIEQGSGGSVYMKSNRDFMQSKFEQIDNRFASIEDRLSRVESQFKEKTKSSASSASSEDSEERKVLVG